MGLKEYVEAAFGMDAEKRILRFLLEKELAGCGDDTLRWLKLFEQCEQWQKQLLLWEENTFVNGIHGWNLCMHAYKLHLPDEVNEGDWAPYLYHITLLGVVGSMSVGKKTSLAEGGRKYHNFSSVADDFYGNGSYLRLTREQWLAELTGLLEDSWKIYQRFPGNNPAYHREMEKNYPRFASILEHLSQDMNICEVVRMNQFGGDDTVWYFAKTQDFLYLLMLSDSM